MYIQEIFFDTMLGDKPVAEFEQWLYAKQSLEKVFSPGEYLELISFGYKGEPVIRSGLYRMLEKLIDPAAFEKYRLLKMMRRALKRDEKLPGILSDCYDLYCSGYSFMETIGMGYGLIVAAPHGANNWEELSEKKQQALLAKFGPELDEEIKKVIYWVESGQVVLTGVKDENHLYEYVDNRNGKV